MELFRRKYLFGFAAIALSCPVMMTAANADPALDAVMQRLDKLEKENAKLKSEIGRIESKSTKTTPAKAGTAEANKSGNNSNFVQVALPKGSYGAGTVAESANYPVSYKDGAEEDDWYFRHKPGSGLTFRTPNGEITVYGRLNMTVQETTPGISGFLCVPPSCGTPNTAIGNLGWLPSIGSSNSYVGIRGYQNIGGGYKDESSLKFVYQLETSIELEATSGISETNSKFSNNVAGGLTSRNSYIGFASDQWGAIKAGKTTAPYANSTAVMNPFAGMLGNYNIIMGNTGGDNRAEFNSRLDHAIWYESPNMKVANGSFAFQALVSPGQNRADNNDNVPLGESDCAGGNSPASGGFATCSDGSFGTAFSAAGTYQTKVDKVGVLVTASYERHQKVNRSSDILGQYGVDPVASGTFPFITPVGLPGPAALSLYNRDVADEDAWKVGAQFKLPTNTTISAIFESMHRYVPADLQFQNERQRNGTWLAISQDIYEKHNLSFGWAHAFKAPGDPCQHNDCTLTHTDADGNMSAFAPNDNAADMLTLAYSYKFAPGFTWFVDYAATINQPSAHYDIAQGGGAATTDCHDASSAIGGVGAPLPAPGNSNPHCWTGGLLQGVQTGVRWNF